MSYLDPAAMAAALERGKADAELSRQSIAQAVIACAGKVGGEAATCFGSALPDDLVNRLSVCDDLSWLPF
jgi:hypothetical protein